MYLLTTPIFAILGVLPFYCEYLWFLEFFAFLPLLVNPGFKNFLLFGLVFASLLYMPFLKAFYLTADGWLWAALTFAVFILTFILFQFGASYLLTRMGVPFPLSYTAVEVLRLFVPFGGFPYEYLGKVLVNAPFLGLSLHYLTVFGGTLFILTVNWLLYKTLEQWESRGKRYILTLLGIFLIPLLLAFAYKLELQIPRYGLKVALVQPFLFQSDKLTNGVFVKLYTTYLVWQTPKSADLVLLPETCISSEGGIYQFAKAFRDKNLLFGALWVFYDFSKADLFAQNLVLLTLKGKIEGIYAKRFLVPFGEYTPKGFSFLVKFFPYLNAPEYLAGKKDTIFTFGGIKLYPLICNEVYFPLWGERDFHIGVVLSNDAWFSPIFAKRHLWEVKLRAIETGRVFIFVNNNGFSGVVYPNGSYIGSPFAKIQILGL
ncbi:MAG TPA: apolipoprotein N-acyltransferase [Aquifex aeolicus]|nr:apolipoprotein N-acyltransferase [Aquificales bacterium]HIQ25838.1 apolipoprotein N-acyltransferase [Aquifex aeolicus]